MNESTRKQEIWYYLWGGVPTQTAHTIYSRRLIFKNTRVMVVYKIQSYLFTVWIPTLSCIQWTSILFLLCMCLCSQEANWQFNALMFGKSTAKLKGKSDFNENKLCTRLLKDFLSKIHCCKFSHTVPQPFLLLDKYLTDVYDGYLNARTVWKSCW